MTSALPPEIATMWTGKGATSLGHTMPFSSERTSTMVPIKRPGPIPYEPMMTGVASPFFILIREPERLGEACPERKDIADFDGFHFFKLVPFDTKLRKHLVGTHFFVHRDPFSPMQVHGIFSGITHGLEFVAEFRERAAGSEGAERRCTDTGSFEYSQIGLRAFLIKFPEFPLASAE